MDRRAFLSVVTGGLALGNPAMAKLGLTSVEVENSFNDRLRSVLQRAQQAGMSVPAAAPSSQGITQTADTLADLVAEATRVKNDESQSEIADDAGQLLSEINRFLRDRSATFGAEAPPSFAALKNQYRQMFDTCRLDQERHGALVGVAKRIAAPSAQDRYRTVEADTGVPWYVIGALHYREASLNFMGHLHNGDYLRLKTVQVPAGRPEGPWPPQPWDAVEAWRLSARDALKSLSHVSNWTVERMLYTFEAYNGWGYRSHKGFVTPYLWNYTQFYKGGGYPCDRCWSATYRSKQAGLVAVLKSIKEVSPESIDFRYEA